MIGPTSIVFAERVTMQATPQDIPGGIPNGRDTAETPAHPGQVLDTISLAPLLTPLGTAWTSWCSLSNFSAHPQHLTEQSLLWAMCSCVVWCSLDNLVSSYAHNLFRLFRTGWMYLPFL